MTRHTVLHIILFIVFIIVVVGLAAALAMVFAPVTLDLDDEGYTLSFLFYKDSAAYEDLSEVALLDEEYVADRIHSYGGISKEFGTYKNDEYGEHFRLTFSENKHNFIMIKKKDGSVIVFNQKSYNATAELYQTFVEKLQTE